MRWNALIFMGSLFPLVPGRTDDAAKLTSRQRREPDRGPILEVRPDRLQPDRQAAARAAGGERRRGLAGQRRQRRTEQAELLQHGGAVHVERLPDRRGSIGAGLVPVRKGRRDERGRQQHVPLAKERAPGRTILLALAEPGDVVGRTALDAALERGAPLVVARPQDLEPRPTLLRRHSAPP